MKRPLIVLFLCLQFMFYTLEAKTIHAILVADTIHPDVHFITWPDLKSIQSELKLVSKHTQAVLKEKIFVGGDFSKSKVEEYLKNLTFGPTDTVIFYFTGHGYRTLQKDTSWPYLSFELYKTGLDMNWVADKIWSKKPQFALIAADCCNNFAERGINRETKNVYLNLHKKNPRFEGYRKLFVNAKGCIVVCSSSAGQFSYGSQYGGLFTYCFLVSLNKEIAQPIPSWKSLLERATSYIGHIQKPICKVYH